MRPLCRRASALLVGLAALASPVAAQSAIEAGGVSPRLLDDLGFRMVGPTRGGRVTAVAGASARPGTFYFGATGGGVWKSTDYGQRWRNVSDGFFATGSIGAIAVSVANPEVVWVGTGSDGIRSNVIVGRGVYRSSDGGRSWSGPWLPTVGQVGAVVVHPADPDQAFVAALGNPFAPSADRGVYRTRDGGRTWSKVLFVSDSTGAVDLELAPDDPRVIYASMWRGERKPWTIISGAREGGIYKSTDGGDTWAKLGGGLPSGLFGKSDLAVSAADPARVYALIEAPVGEGGVYRSDDRGATWRLVSTQASLLDRPFYYTNIDADPTDPDKLFVNSTGFFLSTDAGRTWERRSTPHGDNHDLWIDPRDPEVWIQSNDGGANVTRDGGRTWSSLFNQPTAELYQVAVDDRTPYWLYAGQQDNSTIAVPSLPPASWSPDQPAAWWKQIGGCETGPAIPKPGDPDIVYANCKGQFGRYNDRTGQEQAYWVGARDLYGHNPKEMRDRFQRVSPIHVSPHDPGVVYHASQFLYKTLDEGRSWIRISPDLTANPVEGQVISGAPITRDITGEEYYSTIYAVRESPHRAGTILVGTNDGLVQLTRDGGASWSDVTPKDLPKGGRVQHVEWSPHRPGTAYVAAYRTLLGDFAPYGFRTDDYGRTWTRLTSGANGIPADHPVRVIVEDPSRAGLLYAGTEFGFFVSLDDGGHWESFQRNLPVTPVTDVLVHRKDLVLSTMGRSFWIMDDLSPLHQLGAAVADGPAYLFEPRDALRLRYAAGSGPRDSSAASYPRPGTYFDYRINREPSEVRLEVLSEDGRLLRSFSSEAMGERDRPPAEPGMRGFALERVGTPRLPKTVGHHRFRWDFALAGPWSPDPARSGRSGPWVAPGSYQVRLTVGEWSSTRRFRVEIDPRVAADGLTVADLERQTATAVAVRDLVSEGRAVLDRAETVTTELTALVKSAPNAARRSARERAAALVGTLTEDRTVRYPTPGLVDQIEYLYRLTLTADQRLGRDVAERLEELRGKLREARTRLEVIERERR